MPFTSPIPLCIRRASAPTWVLLPRMTPPLSQYRKRTSWTPRSFASLTICSGVMGVSRSRWLRRRHLLRDHFGPEGEGTVLDGDDRHALLRYMGVRRERDRPGDPREVLRGFDGGLHRGRIGATGALHRVGHQIHGVVPEGGERVLGVVPVFGLVVGDELLDPGGAAGGVHQRMRREEHVLGSSAGHLDEVRRVIAVAADDRAGDARVAELLDERA